MFAFVSENSSVSDIFVAAQRSTSTHSSGIKKLNDLIMSIDSGLMISICRSFIDRLLIVQKSCSDLEKLTTFVACWISSLQDCVEPNSSPDLSTKLFDTAVKHLLERTKVTNKIVRHRSCEIISKIFLLIKDEITEELWEMMRFVLTPRLRDKVASVRVWAIKAIEKLQNAQDKDDFVINEIIRVMTSDASSEVRISAIQSIVICKQSLSHLIERVKDVDADVRIAAYCRLKSDVDPRYLKDSIGDITEYGCQDRDENVRKAAAHMFLQWPQVYQYDVPRILQFIGLSSSPAIAEQYAKAIIKECTQKNSSAPSELQNCMFHHTIDWSSPLNDISIGEILWTVTRCDEYSNSKNSANDIATALELLLPDTIQFCRLMSEAQSAEASEQGFDSHTEMKLQYILRLTSFIDRADEAGRRELCSMCFALLRDTSLPLADESVTQVLDTWRKSEEELVVMQSVVPLAGSLWEESSRRQIELDARLQQLPNEVSGGEEEEEAIHLMRLRALYVASWALQRALVGSSTVRESVASLDELTKRVLQQPLADELRAAAMRCFGLVGLLCCEGRGVFGEGASSDVEYHDRWYRILQTVQITDELPSIRAQALQTLSDMTMVIKQDTERADGGIGSVLLRLIDDEEPLLKIAAIEASAKLLFTGALADPRLFAKLLQKFFVLASELEPDEYQRESSRLQQLLSIFFPAFFRAGCDREHVAIASSIHLISDMSSMLRNDEIDCATLIQVSSNRNPPLKVLYQSLPRCAALADGQSLARAMRPTQSLLRRRGRCVAGHGQGRRGECQSC